MISLKELLKINEVKQVVVSRDSKINPSNLNSYLNGYIKPNKKLINSISKFIDLPKEDLWEIALTHYQGGKYE